MCFYWKDLHTNFNNLPACILLICVAYERHIPPLQGGEQH